MGEFFTVMTFTVVLLLLECENGSRKKEKKKKGEENTRRGAWCRGHESDYQRRTLQRDTEIQLPSSENLHIKRLRMPQKPGCDSQRVEDRRVFVTGRRQSIPRIRRRQNAALSAVTGDSVRAVKSGEVVRGNGSRDYNYPIECCGKEEDVNIRKFRNSLFVSDLTQTDPS